MALQKLQDNDGGRNPNSWSPRERRALERRQDRLLDHLRGVPMPEGFDPTTGLAILYEEKGIAAFVRAESTPLALVHLGLDIRPEPGWWRPGLLAVLVCVDGWSSVAWLALSPMTKGGAA